jgi:Tfp pilus assembly protein PilO
LKLSRQTFIFILIGVVLVTALILSVNGTIARVAGSLFELGRQQRNELNAQLASTQVRLKTVQLEPLTAQKAQLEQQLVQSTDQMKKVRSMLEQPINKTEIIGVLFTTAKAHNLAITQMSLSGLTDAHLAEVPVSSVQLAISVEGNLMDIVGFISELNTLYTFGAVNSATVINPDTKGVRPAHADVTLTLYTVQGK